MTCTCHALANAIADKLFEEHDIDVDQRILANILVNNNGHVGPVWPDIYHNYDKPILVMNETSKKWISINITVKRVERFINGEKHLLSYLSERGKHCVFVKEQIEDSYKCVNSWGGDNSSPAVPVGKLGNILWVVRVEFKIVPDSEFMTLNCISKNFLL